MSTIQPRENCSTMNLKWHWNCSYDPQKHIDVRTPVPNCIALTVSILMIFSPFHGRYKTYFVADVKFWSEWGAAVLTICNFNPLAPPPPPRTAARMASLLRNQHYKIPIRPAYLYSAIGNWAMKQLIMFYNFPSFCYCELTFATLSKNTFLKRWGYCL